MTKCCSRCRQPLPKHRFGIDFRPQEGLVFDIIAKAGERGVSREDLAELIGSSVSTISTQVNYINEELLNAETGRHIYNFRGFRGGGIYRLIEWGVKKPSLKPAMTEGVVHA